MGRHLKSTGKVEAVRKLVWRGSFLVFYAVMWGFVPSSVRYCKSFKHLLWLPWSRKWQPTPTFLPGKSKDRGIWQATVHGVAKSQTRLSGWAHRHAGLSGSTWTLHSLMWRARPSVVACEIWFPNQGWGPILLHWECGVLATRPPGKSQDRAIL